MKTTHQISLIAILSAILIVAQVSLSFIPNVELVSFLFIIYGLYLPFSMNIIIVLLFTTLEMLVWGVGDWVFGYFWIWPIWVILIYVFKPILKENTYGWALLSGFWGLLFGALFAINHGFFYGFNYSMAYYLKGIPFDIIHTLGNFVVALLLFKPTTRLFESLVVKGRINHEHKYEKR